MSELNTENVKGLRPARTRIANRVACHLLQPVPIDFLVVYRIGFGAMMCWWAVNNIRAGIPYYDYTLPRFHFTYYGFDWIKPWKLDVNQAGILIDGMTLHFIALAGLSVLICLGLWYRIAATLFGLGYLYWFLLDKSYYLNHYYLCAILGVMMPFLPAHRAFSIDSLKRPLLRAQSVPAWTLWLLRFQIGVPYFFGGIAKINADWLRGQPMRTTLSRMQDHPWIANFPYDHEYLVQVICWGGVFFDLAIVPLLLIPRTRLPAFLLACGFHFSNAKLWNIGIFPWLMVIATTVYFRPDWPRHLTSFLRHRKYSDRPVKQGVSSISGKQRATVLVVVGWMMVQCLIPLRVFITPGNPSWTEYAHHFSWHMLLRAKTTGLRVYATDPKTRRSGSVDLRNYLTVRQLSVVGRDPRLIHQLCLFVSDDLASKGYQNLEIRALALASLNGRRPQLLIDPTVDLASQPRNLAYPDWIMELQEPYRHTAWDYPLSEWEVRLALNLPDEMREIPVDPSKKKMSQEKG